MTVDAVAIALETAAAHPAARLPCPICAATVNAENLGRHVEKVHPQAPAVAPPWNGKGAFGIARVSLSLEGDAVVFTHTFGMFRRRIPLPCTLEVGALFVVKPDPLMGNDDSNAPGIVERAGSYIRLVGKRKVTIGCRAGMQLGKHWDPAWTMGGQRRRTNILVDRPSLVALEYALAARGVLRPR